LGLGLSFCNASTLRGQTTWQTGKEYWQQLELPASVEWSGSDSTLRQATTNFARSQGVCIWLDRRLDPGYQLAFAADREPLNRLLKRLAAHLAAGAGFLDSVVYLGPPPTASKLATLAALRTEEAGKLPPSRRAVLLERRAWEWEDLATPRELIGQLARDVSLSVVGGEQLPHDLWPAQRLPPLNVPERLSLVLAGFDLTFEFCPKGDAIRFLPMPETAALVRTYAVRGNAERAAEQVGQVFPRIQVRRAGPKLVVTALYEDHVLVGRWLRGERVAVEGVTRYTLTIENQPLGAVLTAIARRLGHVLEVDPSVASRLEQQVSFHADNATVEGLLRTTVRGTGVRCEIQGDRLRVLPER
jgi:hypothetical protein